MGKGWLIVVVIDLGCGKSKRREAFGFDCRKELGVNALCDIERPLPLKSNCADVVHLSHVMEHVRNLIPFMEEVYRICKSGAEIQVTVPYYTSRGAFRDPTHVRYIAEDTFQYFEQPTDYGCRPIFASKLFTSIRANPFDNCQSMCANVARIIC